MGSEGSYGVQSVPGGFWGGSLWGVRDFPPPFPPYFHVPPSPLFRTRGRGRREEEGEGEGGAEETPGGGEEGGGGGGKEPGCAPPHGAPPV